MRTPRPSRRVAAAPSGSPDVHMCPGQGAQVIRAWEPGGHRSAEVAVLKFRGWHVCARCHRYKKNLRAILRSDSELISLSDRILLLVACRPTCSCHTRLCRRHGQTGSSNRKTRSALQGRWAFLDTHTWMQMPPDATDPGYGRSYWSRRPAS